MFALSMLTFFGWLVGETESAFVGVEVGAEVGAFTVILDERYS